MVDSRGIVSSPTSVSSNYSKPGQQQNNTYRQKRRQADLASGDSWDGVDRRTGADRRNFRHARGEMLDSRLGKDRRKRNSLSVKA